MSSTTYFVHGPDGFLEQQNPDGSWEQAIKDGLGSARGTVDANLNALGSRQYSPFGEPFGETGTNQTPFGFTGEPMDSNGLVYLRARYYNPATGTFPNPDPLEGNMVQPMSLNRYSYVQGNPPNRADPSGMSPLPVQGYAPPNIAQTLQAAARSSDPLAMLRAIGQINGGCNSPTQQQVKSKFVVVKQSQLFDNHVGNIPINQLTSTYEVETDGQSIRSLNAFSVAAFHKETGIFGDGWTGRNAYDIINWGGIGLNGVQLQAHAEFDYRGLFDVGKGNTFYTVIDNITTIWANGVVDCRQTIIQTKARIIDSYQQASCVQYIIQ